MSTEIEWTHITDNFIGVIGGGYFCIKTSEGCAGCYSEALNQNSFFGGNKLRYSGKPPELVFKREILQKWSRMRIPKLHFCSSMTDIFGNWVPLEWQLEFLTAMANAPKQVFQLLTKHPDIMLIAVQEFLRINNLSMLPDNIAVGTSVENFPWLVKRSPILQSIPAKIHFLSCEPIINEIFGFEDVDYQKYLGNIQWLILGGESANTLQPEARMCHINWIEQGIDIGNKLNIPVFVKQFGSNPYWSHPISGVPLKMYLQHKKGGNIGEWDNKWKVRQFPEQWLKIISPKK